MKNFRLLLLALAACLPILACILSGTANDNNSSDPGISPTTEGNSMDPSTQANCLFGTWKVVDLSSVILAAVPAETIEQYSLKYRSTSGDLFVIFHEDGSIDIQADQLQIEFGAKVTFFTVPLIISLDGAASGTYITDGTTLTTSGFDTSGLTASARAAGQNVVEQDQIISAIPMLKPPYNVAVFTCSGDSLQASVTGYPAAVPPVEFERVP